MRIVHLSDVHVWRWPCSVTELLNKRVVGVAALLRGRAGRFPQERIAPLIDRVRSVGADHILITGDLTTTALPSEFAAALEMVHTLASDGPRVTVIPGNHDRYTGSAARAGLFDSTFRDFLPEPRFPWLTPLDSVTQILGLDPTRAHLTASGFLSEGQLSAARSILQTQKPKRLIVACHYPLEAPPPYEHDLARKPLSNPGGLIELLAAQGRHLYCCGHVHATWAYRTRCLPDQFSLNPGPPIMRQGLANKPPGFLVIDLRGGSVAVEHHGRAESGWVIEPLAFEPEFYASESLPSNT